MIPQHVFEETLLGFFAPIRAYLDDPSVSEVMINGPDMVYVERAGLLTKVESTFANREALQAALRNLSQYVGKHVSEERPILEARFPDGSRVQAVLPPAAPDGPYVSIRRFFKETLTVDRLLKLGSLTPLAAETLKAFVVAKLNIMVAGGTGTGKTSMLNALSGFIPDGERVIVIEDSREVQFHKPHVLHLESRPADTKGKGAITIRDLFRATLRMRPDRVIVGEIRGGEALDIVQAMTSGHGGCMGTLHATYPRDTLSRLETMAMMNELDMPLAAMRQQIGSAIELIVQLARHHDGSRKVSHITEVLGFDVAHQQYTVRDIFVREYGKPAPGQAATNDLVATGYLPSCLPQLRQNNVELPRALIDIAAQKERALGHA